MSSCTQLCSVTIIFFDVILLVHFGVIVHIVSHHFVYYPHPFKKMMSPRNVSKREQSTADPRADPTPRVPILRRSERVRHRQEQELVWQQQDQNVVQEGVYLEQVHQGRQQQVQNMLQPGHNHKQPQQSVNYCPNQPPEQQNQSEQRQTCDQVHPPNRLTFTSTITPVNDKHGVLKWDGGWTA